jgi:hypothetical protein
MQYILYPSSKRKKERIQINPLQDKKNEPSGRKKKFEGFVPVL